MEDVHEPVSLWTNRKEGRHAANGDELLTAERRVDKALMKIKSDRAFTEDQEKWLALIRRNLIENLLLGKEDFDFLPIFIREGASWPKLNKVFDGQLETLIHEINEAMAA
jgi:type I restriction enzyme R subunit